MMPPEPPAAGEHIDHDRMRSLVQGLTRMERMREAISWAAA